jgi:hypothetical protein
MDATLYDYEMGGEPADLTEPPVQEAAAEALPEAA